jgi:hypothetical protein
MDLRYLSKVLRSGGMGRRGSVRGRVEGVAGEEEGRMRNGIMNCFDFDFERKWIILSEECKVNGTEMILGKILST